MEGIGNALVCWKYKTFFQLSGHVNEVMIKTKLVLFQMQLCVMLFSELIGRNAFDVYSYWMLHALNSMLPLRQSNALATSSISFSVTLLVVLINLCC